ncbi:MAG: peroxidase-related enzyme [Candidatus Eisenbacteria bacterium]|uniref:Peroxidase-related enzyme n=1 Tax=Eiseniibacteriota bacterium TaxID=2212470 RepID=A0A956SHI6_UNCEI|nr:peroxidase-related enzyme [Candidatus Eisenbacteria bacterium]MCB9465267.1 peroxidase-related enzyme [Candidatus Eisenbacteria bacterium]
MSYVKQVNEDNASGAIRRVFDASMARDGEISELIRATSLDAKSTQAAHNLDTNLMKTKNALTPERRALLGMVVGNANICYYTTFQYFKEYVEATGNKKLAEQVTLDYRKAALEEGDRSLCDYAVKLTLQPGEMTADDIDAARTGGNNDETIVVATQVISYINYTSRVANALGVEPEVWMMEEPEDWLKRRAKDFLEAKGKKK